MTKQVLKLFFLYKEKKISVSIVPGSEDHMNDERLMLNIFTLKIQEKYTFKKYFVEKHKNCRQQISGTFL